METLLSEFSIAKNEAVSFLILKCDSWVRIPWSFAAIAHHDPAVERAGAVRCVSALHAQKQAGAHHRRVNGESNRTKHTPQQKRSKGSIHLHNVMVVRAAMSGTNGPCMMAIRLQVTNCRRIVDQSQTNCRTNAVYHV